MNVEETISELIEAGRRLDQLGFVPATDGNLSVRLTPREIVATVSGVRKGFLTRRDFTVVDPEGKPLRGGPPVSTEILMHLKIYAERSDVRAVVHAHPPTATGFAVAGIPLEQCVLPEVVCTIGSVPLAPYATPSTRDLPESIGSLVKDHDAILLANHGAVTCGTTLFHAMNRMETVEQFAKILFVARTLGTVNLLSREQVEDLNAIRHRYGLSGRAAACEPGPQGARATGDETGAAADRDLVDRVLVEVLKKLQS
jgi:L-fuculose-phosphate aldolase